MININGLEINEKEKYIRRIASDDDDDDDTEIEDEIEESEDKKLYVTSKQPLPDIFLEKFPLFVETILPSYGTLDSNFTVINRIKNNSKTLLSLECSLEDNAFFSIGGNKLVII